MYILWKPIKCQDRKYIHFKLISDMRSISL